MRPLNIDKKTGFRSTMPFLINDQRNIIFYSSDFTDKIASGKPLEFNMMPGKFMYDGNFVKLDSPVPVKNIATPLKERNVKAGRFDIQFGNNPNKCTIFYDAKVILFDNSFLNKPLYIKYTIYFHELAHLYYVTESKADLYACKVLLELGFNPSQICLAFIESLSDASVERQTIVINNLTNNEG
jgi:hypothetical protein